MNAVGSRAVSRASEGAVVESEKRLERIDQDLEVAMARLRATK